MTTAGPGVTVSLHDVGQMLEALALVFREHAARLEGGPSRQGIASLRVAQAMLEGAGMALRAFASPDLLSPRSACLVDHLAMGIDCDRLALVGMRARGLCSSDAELLRGFARGADRARLALIGMRMMPTTTQAPASVDTSPPTVDP